MKQWKNGEMKRWSDGEMEKWSDGKRVSQYSSTPRPIPDVQGLPCMASSFTSGKIYKRIRYQSRQGAPIPQYSRPPRLKPRDLPASQARALRAGAGRAATPSLHHSKLGGFTLLEVMIAVTIIAIVLVAVFGSQSQSLSLANEAKFSTTAALLAQKKMAEVEAEDSLDLISNSGDFGEDFPQYNWEVNVSDIPMSGVEGLDYLKQVDVAIRWGGKNQYQYELRLYRFVPGPE